MPKLRPLPTPDEARAGLHAAAASAEQHLAVAKLLASAGHHGPACSQLILAQEETVKARALGWIWIDRDCEEKTYDEREIRERLSGHPPRHKAAIVQSWSGGLQSEIVARSLREAIRNQAALQGMSWPDLQWEVARRGKHLPDIPTSEECEDELRQNYPNALDGPGSRSQGSWLLRRPDRGGNVAIVGRGDGSGVRARA